MIGKCSVKRVALFVRVKPDVKSDLVAAAKGAGRSVAAEIERLVGDSRNNGGMPFAERCLLESDRIKYRLLQGSVKAVLAQIEFANIQELKDVVGILKRQVTDRDPAELRAVHEERSRLAMESERSSLQRASGGGELVPYEMKFMRRRTNLTKLVGARGMKKRLAVSLGVPPNWVTYVLRRPGEPRHRWIDDGFAKKIEAFFGLNHPLDEGLADQARRENRKDQNLTRSSDLRADLLNAVEAFTAKAAARGSTDAKRRRSPQQRRE